MQRILMPVCGSIAQRSVLIQPCNRSSTDHRAENVDVECAAFKLVNMCCGKNCLRLDLLDCEDILLCCSGSTDLVFNWRCKLRWKQLNAYGSYLVPSCLRTEMKNLDIGKSKSLVGIFTIALDSFSDSQNSSMRLSRSKSCIECV